MPRGARRTDGRESARAREPLARMATPKPFLLKLYNLVDDAKTQHMLSFAGLRGVVAFACVVQWPEEVREYMELACEKATVPMSWK